jgi:hypothetical protein
MKCNGTVTLTFDLKEITADHRTETHLFCPTCGHDTVTSPCDCNQINFDLKKVPKVKMDAMARILWNLMKKDLDKEKAVKEA